jgi:hypothetical protein
MRRIAAPVLAAALLLAAAAAPGARAAEEPLRPLGSKAPPGRERLSDERTLSRWAYLARRGWARARPSPSAPRITRLRRLTEDEQPELYLTLRTRPGTDGRLWVQVRLPMRPNGTAGWVPRGDLGELRPVTTSLEIDRKRSRAILRRAWRTVWRARIGHGARTTPTPAGRFYVREKLNNAGGDPIYGPWAIGTSAYSRLSDWPGGGVIGIHGTNEPGRIPGRPSHGCIRLRNAEIARLVRRVPLGTPVWIH